MGARILVVEDNRTNLELMTYLLRAFGYEPDGVADGLLGLEAARKGNYDLVLCDVLMPGIDGFEFARRFKAEPLLKDRTLVAVTALAMVGDRERLLAAGFDAYISKPINPETFIQQIEANLREHPHAPVERKPSQRRPSSAPSDSPTGPVILIVDDVQINLDVLRGALQPFGYRIIEARGVREASGKIEETKPELVLCDVHMRDGHGFELLAMMKSNPELSRIPFLFLSSTAWLTEERRRGIELGASRFLLRPIDPQHLLDEVEAALSGAGRAEDSRR